VEIDFKQVLEEKKALVWPEIKNYLDKFSDFPQFYSIPKKYSSIKKFHQKMVGDYPNRKGKYFRPSLVLLTAQAMGYPVKKAIKTAAAYKPLTPDGILKKAYSQTTLRNK